MADRILEGDRSSDAEYHRPYDKIIQWGLAAFLFLFPLVYSPVNFDGYGLPRLFLLRAFSFFLGLVWFIKVCRTGNLRLIARPVLLPLVAYIVTALLSTLNSPHLSTSLYGNFSRYEGFLTTVNYAFLLLLVANFCSETRCLIRLFRAATVSAALVAIIGLYQYVDSNFSVRAFSTFSNPDFLGYYLVAILPLSIGLLLVESDFRLKILWLSASALSFACLVATFTRGAWLGFLGSAALLGLALGSRLWKQRKAVSVSLLIPFLLSALAIYYVSSPSSAKEVSLKRRLASVVQFTGGTARARIELWRVTLNMIQRRPFMGWGPDSLSLVYPRYKSPGFVQLEGSDVTPDKAHNEFLQAGATLGLVGLAAYLWFLFALFGTGHLIFKNLNSYYLKVAAAAVLAGGVGYLVALQFLFSEVSIAPFFWIEAGLILALGRSEGKGIPAHDPSVHFTVLPKAKKLRWSLIFLGVLLVTFLLLNNAKLVLADYYVQLAREKAKKVLSEQSFPEEWASSQAYYRRALMLNPSNPLYFLAFGGSSLGVGRKWSDRNLIGEAITNFEKAVALNNRLEEAYLGLGDSHSLMGKITGDLRHSREAERSYREVIELDPLRALAYFKLGQLFTEEGQFGKGVRHFQKAAQADFRYTEIVLGAANHLQGTGRLQEAENIYRELSQWNPGDANVINDLAVLLAQTGRLGEAIRLWNKAIALDPSNVDLYFNLGFAYEKQKKADLALKNYQKALAIDPADERVREALRRLAR